MDGEPLSEAELEALRALVRSRHVVYEVGTVEEMVGDERRKIGFNVVLSGTDGTDNAVAVVGAQAAEVWSDLARIARAILPPPGNHSVLGLEAFDLAVHNTPLRGNRDDIELVIGIRHELGALDPIDSGEEQTLKVVLAALKKLGVPQATWTQRS